jgi:hypothetical protein
MAMKHVLTMLAACVIAGPAHADEPVGCDKFKWPIDKELTVMIGDTIAIPSGTNLPKARPVSVIVALKPFADAKLPTPPERTPKSPDSYAGFVQAAAPAKAVTYKISLSAEGWIDVVQDGQIVKSSAFSGALGCEGIRKSVKFDLAAKPFTVELSGVKNDSIRIAITGD